MKSSLTFPAALLFTVCFLAYSDASAQDALNNGGMHATATWMASPQPEAVSRPTPDSRAVYSMDKRSAPNYRSFSSPVKHISEEALAANVGYQHHPELGILYREAPCSNCYELIGERTETTKTFVKEGGHDGYQEKMVQTSTQPMHYRDAAGNWRTIVSQLQPEAGRAGVYSVLQEETPVTISTDANSFSSLGSAGMTVKFNRLELVYVSPAGEETSLGKADWSHHTAGNQGVYVTDAWPGIDIEITVLRAALKTNFHVKTPMPSYAAGKLLVRDNMELAAGLQLSHGAGSKVNGDLLIKNNKGETKYGIGAALVYEQGTHAELNTLDYYVGNNNTVDIAVPGAYLNKPASSYPIIIDPLVSLATSIPVAGTSYNATWALSSGCLYTNPANTPVNCTVTGIEFQFEYTTPSVPMQFAAFSFYKGICRSPTPTAFSWSCASSSPGTCAAIGGATYDIFSSLSACLPPPSCASIPLNIQMYFYQNWAVTASCVSTYCYGSQPLIFTVFGRTVQVNTATASPATICAGASSTLTATGIYGVGPYTYSWIPGPVSGSPAVVSPSTSTTYTLTVTDACGITASGTAAVTVNTVPPITGTTQLCIGNSSTLSNASAGTHTWGSSNPAVATITSPGGVLSAIAAGTATVTYTLSATGCYTTTVVTVDPLPAPIGGTSTLCVGGTTVLTNSSPGGSWTSSGTAIVTVSSTGMVTGVAVGTAIITYGSAACYVTTVVTVDFMAPITGSCNICKGAVSSLANSVGGGAWSSSTATVATIGGSGGAVMGMGGGTALISYVAPTGCYATAVVTVIGVPAIAGTPSMCMGQTTTLSNSMGGGTWSSSNGSVAPIGAVTGVVTGVSMGTTMITYTESTIGCMTTMVATVNPVPDAINGVASVCIGLTTSLSDATPGGTWSSSTTGVATVGGGLVTGMTNGAATITYQLSTGCYVTVPVVVNPLPAAITGPGQVCLGFSVTLSDADAGGAWSSSNTAIATIDGPSGIATGVTAGNATITYTLGTGCLITTVLKVMPLPVADYFVKEDICPGEDVPLALISSGVGVVDYIWDFSGATIVTASSNHGGPYILKWSAIGVYTISLVAVSSAGCSSRPFVDTIKVHDYPDAGIGPIAYLNSKSAALCIGDSVVMQARTNLSMYKYEWFPAPFFRYWEGNRVTGAINAPGYITLLVTDPFGCQARDSVFVDAQPCCEVFFPTAFTPNGDGKNDVFRVAGLGHHQLDQFRVVNRWGQSVFETVSETTSWDGTYNGVPQDMGVYYYVFTYDCEGKSKTVKGDVTLIR